MIDEDIKIGDMVVVEYSDGDGRKLLQHGELAEYYEDPDFCNEGRVKLYTEHGNNWQGYAFMNGWIKVHKENDKSKTREEK